MESKFQGVAASFQSNISTFLNDASIMQTKKRGEVVLLPLDSLVENQFEKQCYDTEDIEALALDISARGIQNPLRVVPLSGDKYEIISGHRRKLGFALAREAHKYSEDCLPCIIEEPPVKEREFEKTEHLILNNLQRNKKDFERMMEIVIFKQCVEQRREAGEDIPNVRDYVKERLGVSDTMITRSEKIYTSLIPELMADFRAARIAHTVCYDIAKLDENLQRAIDATWNREKDKVLTLNLVNEIAAAAIAKNETPPTDREKKTTAQIDIPMPKSLPESVQYLDNAFNNLTQILQSDVKLDRSTHNKIMRKIHKQLMLIHTLQNELKVMGLVDSND